MSILNSRVHLLLLSLALLMACSRQETASVSEKSTTSVEVPPAKEPQIADYIRNIFQDKEGNLWFGTNGYGVAHFDGKAVSYFSNEEGFHGQQITGITEDLEKNIWFATDQGVVKYAWLHDQSGIKQFTNFSEPQYFDGQRFWSICADSKGRVWAGGVSGIFRFDGESWTTFALPYPEEITGDFITKATSWSISEDRAGNMWFSTNGFGAFKYDGQSFTQYTDKEGLTDNHVDQILEDRKGNIWLGTRFGGVSRFDGEHFTNFNQKNGTINNDEVCAIYEDKAGNIWFSSEGYGVYRYDGASFTNFSEKQGLGVRAVQTIFEDREGRFWVGGGGGLYRMDGQSFFHVSAKGLADMAGSQQQNEPATGLKIEYKPTRGQSYTDSQGTKYQLRHIPASIKNDNTIPIHLQIAFSDEYDYPADYDDQQFRIFPMPKEWALDGVDITEDMETELAKYIDQPNLSKTLAPGETWQLAFGTLYPQPVNYGVFPIAVFSPDARDISKHCAGKVDSNLHQSPASGLKLLIGFTSGSQASPNRCMTISMGQTSYVER